MNTLSSLFNDGDTLYGINHKTNANSDIIQVLFVHNGRIEDLTRRIAKTCGLKLRKLGIQVNGTGFSKIGAIVEEVERVTGKKLKYESISTNQL